MIFATAWRIGSAIFVATGVEIAGSRTANSSPPYLDRERRKKLEYRLRRRRTANLVLPVIEFADLSDKRLVLVALCGLDASADQELREIEELRNAVAHARDYARTFDDLRKFIERMSLARNWINRLPKLAVGKA